LLGAPGAGKGTQAEILSRRLSIPTISTGNLLRAAVQAGTPVGHKAKVLMDQGKLVPDDVVLSVLEDRVSQPDCKDGYILDGVPRTIAQADVLEQDDVKFDAVISLEISDEDIEIRMTGRRTCTHCGATFHTVSNPPKREGICDVCGGELILRADDALETVRNRLRVYHATTEPLKDYYKSRGILKVVPNQPPIEATTKVVLQALEM
ncbi:MAG: adenylate kinase, partial [Pseudoflavonifractor sp.]